MLVILHTRRMNYFMKENLHLQFVNTKTPSDVNTVRKGKRLTAVGLCDSTSHIHSSGKGCQESDVFLPHVAALVMLADEMTGTSSSTRN